MMRKYLNEAREILSLEELRIFPSYLAYNFVLALIPIFTILIMITGILSISTDTVIEFIRSNIPDNIANIIIGIISSKNYGFSIGFLNITTLYVSSRGMYALIETANRLYGVGKIRFVKKRLKAVFILFLIIFSLLFLLLIPLLGNKVLYLLSNHKLITKELLLLYRTFKWPLTFAFIYLNIKLIYIISPSKKISGSNVRLGAFVTSVGWILFTYIFGYYLDYFSKYDLLYGSLSSIVILLVWLYVLSYILILGIIINTRKYNKE